VHFDKAIAVTLNRLLDEIAETARATSVENYARHVAGQRGSLAIQPRWTAMNKCLAQSNKSRAGKAT
jgi:hypothetical protein